MIIMMMIIKMKIIKRVIFLVKKKQENIKSLYN